MSKLGFQAVKYTMHHKVDLEFELLSRVVCVRTLNYAVL